MSPEQNDEVDVFNNIERIAALQLVIETTDLVKLAIIDDRHTFSDFKSLDEDPEYQSIVKQLFENSKTFNDQLFEEIETLPELYQFGLCIRVSAYYYNAYHLQDMLTNDELEDIKKYIFFEEADPDQESNSITN